MMSSTESMTSWTLFQNYLILRRSIVANFADIIKIAPIFIKAIIEDSEKVMYSNTSISILLDVTKIVDFWWEYTDVSRTQEVCQVIYMCLYLLWVRYNCVKFHHCRMCRKFQRVGPFCRFPYSMSVSNPERAHSE